MFAQLHDAIAFVKDAEVYQRGRSDISQSN